jgi:hypothetical protein
MVTIPEQLRSAVVMEEADNLFETGEAVFDVERVYRYVLARQWGSGPRVLFVMLNPSTADAGSDDPTLRRCTGFARRHGFAGLTVVNLFSLRATDPARLAEHPDPVGPHADEFIEAAAQTAARHIVAWGAHGTDLTRNRAATVTTALNRFLRQHRRPPLACLGLSRDGHPRHPLYLSGDSPLQPYRPMTGPDDTGGRQAPGTTSPTFRT